MYMLLSVAAGGAVGAAARYWLSGQVQHLLGSSLPWGTLAVNVLGCAVLGILVQLMAQVWSPAAELRAFLTVGLLGAMTTFSAFSLEVLLMIETGDWFSAALYIVLSVVLSVGALMLALVSMRYLLT
ncbi:MAG: fluoride efflux transporter CrcB [Rhodospirillaceae bacterium]|jgi:fluoride exporter|nr:fluoride efflux transporter CrcB [Rhodospirillaceae bacterium]